MDVLLNALKKSIMHLEIIDEVFSTAEYPEKEIYQEIKKSIKALDSKIPENKFSEELYVGGKKRNTAKNQGYGRQMILSDVLEYIVNGRGYFYAIRNKETMKNYLNIILHLINQLMLIDSIVVEVKVRQKLLKELESRIGDDFFKEPDRRKEHEALLLHDAPIGFPLAEKHVDQKVLDKLGLDASQKAVALKKLEEYYDSLLPKTAGGLWGELLVYAYLLRRNLGFVFPLVLNQRLITGDASVYLKPPDFLLLPFGTNTFYGIEVGAGKDIQSGTFSIITSIPTATKANADNPKRCCICGKWMLFCPQVIQDYSDTDKNIEDLRKPIKCLKECRLFSREEIMAGKCPYAMHKGGKPKKHIMEMKGETYHFHLKCLLHDPEGKEQISENNIVEYYPYVHGLEAFEKLKPDQKTLDEKMTALKELIRDLGESSDKN